MSALRLLAIAVSAFAATLAWGGQACTEFKPTPETVRNALNLAHKVRQGLEQSGAEVALVARIGQDLSKYKLRYSHLGYAWRDHPNGRWTLMHLLNQCGTTDSGIYAEGLGNFFLDDVFVYEALLYIPGKETQKLLAGALGGARPTALHGLPYNMLAYAYSTRYQNSNQWVLEVFAAASARDAPVASRQQAQAWLKLAGYEPITLQIDALTRLGGRMFRANVAFDDHPFDRRMAGQIDAVTVESVIRFLERRDAEHKKVVVRVD